MTTLRKIIRDMCIKTAFSYIYEQTDGVSMGGSLGPVFIDIVMTEFEKNLHRKLIN